MRSLLRIDRQFSWQLFALITVLHGLALLVLLGFDWLRISSLYDGALVARLLKLVAVFWLFLSFVWQLRRHCFFSAVDTIRRVGFDGTGWWLDINDKRLYAELQGDSVVMSRLIVLNFCLEPDQVAFYARWRSVVLFNDSTDREMLRQLRVFLRFQSAEALSLE